jgi:hypothetical protein
LTRILRMSPWGHFRPSSAKNADGGSPPKSFRGRRVLMTEDMGQGMKSLRSSPLRGYKSREAGRRSRGQR